MAGGRYLGWYCVSSGTWRPLSGAPVRMVGSPAGGRPTRYRVVADETGVELAHGDTRRQCIRAYRQR